jgi:suppressor of ftsI
LKKARIAIALFSTMVIAGGLVVFTARTSAPEQVSLSADGSFSRSLDDIQPSSETELIELNDGDEFEITAKATKHTINGQEVRMLSYNGSIPGPTVVVTEGDEIVFDIKNELDVETTIHPHGINADSANDGVPDISQEPIEMGANYKQTISFPEPGLFWYHPHVREDYTQASGMFANFIVKPKDPATWPVADREEILQLGDVSMTNNGLLEFNKEKITHTVMGRFGNTQIVNGRTDYVVDAKQNEVTRLYLTNTSSARSFRFEIPGIQLKLIGGDNGLYERDEFVDTVTIAPSERAIVDVMFKEPGQYTMQNNNEEANTRIAEINVQPSSMLSDAALAFESEEERPEVSETINSLLLEAETSGLSKRLATRVDMNPQFMQSMAEEMARVEAEEAGEEHSGIEWEDEMPDANSRSDADNTQWSLVDIDNPREKSFEWSFKQNDVVTITVENSERTMHPMQHPIHIHGQKFIVKSINGEPTENRVFKDVVQVPVGDTYELVVKMANPGTWLLHCHISEHMESGMVGKYTVQ